MDVLEEGTKVIIKWMRGDTEDVDKARDLFTKLTRQGWIAARCDGGLRRVLEFKPEYEELWFIPLSEGG